MKVLKNVVIGMSPIKIFKAYRIMFADYGIVSYPKDYIPHPHLLLPRKNTLKEDIKMIIADCKLNNSKKESIPKFELYRNEEKVGIVSNKMVKNYTNEGIIEFYKKFNIEAKIV